MSDKLNDSCSTHLENTNISTCPLVPSLVQELAPLEPVHSSSPNVTEQKVQTALTPCTRTFPNHCESYAPQLRSSTPTTSPRTDPHTDWYFFLHHTHGDLPWIAALPL